VGGDNYSFGFGMYEDLVDGADCHVEGGKKKE